MHPCLIVGFLSLLGDVTPFVCEVVSLLCAHKTLLAHIRVGHPPRSGDRLSKVLPASLCYTGGAERLAAGLRFPYFNRSTL